MRGDFSRFTFDPLNHYRSVYMQQGRVQLDADWNEQIDILHHYLESYLRDLLGPGAGQRESAGFEIRMVEESELEEQETRRLPRISVEENGSPEKEGSSETGGQAREQSNDAAFDLHIGYGRYYVDGVLYENEQSVLFSAQPDYPGAAFPTRSEEHAHAIVYLDAWQHHITAFEEPALLETALENLDTTTRVQNLWQVKILPVRHHPALADHERVSYAEIASLPEWNELLNRQGNRGQLSARHQPDSVTLDNQLYRVEIHDVRDERARFKWSRENGSIVFDVQRIESIRPPEKEGGPAQLTLTLGQQGRDITLLHTGDWVEIVDNALVLRGPTLPLYQVILAPDAVNRQVIVQGPPSAYLEALGQQPANRLLLRRWDHGSSPHGLTTVRVDEWLNLEHGIQVRFTGEDNYQVGDYWLIPSRALSDSIAWPADENNEPLSLWPRGIYHHYSPLALLHRREERWRVAKDLRQFFDPLPLLTEVAERIRPREPAVTEIVEVRQPAGPPPNALFEDCASEERLEVGDLVSLVPGPHRRVARATRDNAGLVFGVVTAVREVSRGRYYQAMIYGRTRCKITERAEPGDLLTVAEIAGCATRTGPAHELFHPGTILGKALEPYEPEDDDDVGMIMIMVTLQ
jgi:hypothetical protein